MLLRLGHSPDPDDAFMFYGLARGLVETRGLRFEHVVQDIETLNKRAEKGELEITALSVHAYAYLHDRYRLLPCGASMGEGYGPLLVSRQPMTISDLRSARVAVPGLRTSAYLAARLLLGDFEHEVVPFDEIMEYVGSDRADAGLLIHEGQLTYKDAGLYKVVDLGEWWHESTDGLPLPLGVNTVRADLPEDVVRRATEVLRQSIRYALENRAEAVQYAMQFGRGLDGERTDRFCGMYVNKWTEELGEVGSSAIHEFLRRGHEAGILPQAVRLDRVG